MVSVTILRDRENRLRGFETSGHAGYAAKGQDIVCAAVSVLTINTVNSLERFTEDTFALETEERAGRIAVRFSDPPGEKAALLLSSYELGIREIVRSYGKKYLSMEIEEVKTC